MQIEWLSNALEDWETAVDYGLRTFGERITERFNRELEKCEKRLLVNPYMGKLEPLLESAPQGFRSIVFQRHYKLVYYIEGDLICIVALFDTRRNPNALTDYFR